jgi:hypothetical protein
VRRIALSLLLVAAPATVEAQFRDETAGVEITPPEYMLRQGEDLLAPPTLISCWYAPATEEEPWVKLCAERLDQLPKADEKLSLSWHDRTLRGSRTQLRIENEDVVLLSTLLPLHLGTVRLDVVTPVHGADAGRAVLDETLASVKDVGPWIVPRDGAAASSDQPGKRTARLVGKIGTILIISGVGMWIRQRRARKKGEPDAAGLAA